MGYTPEEKAHREYEETVMAAVDPEGNRTAAEVCPQRWFEARVACVQVMSRSEQDMQYLQEHYPQHLEGVTTEWLALLLGTEMVGFSVKKILDAGVMGDAAILSLEYAEVLSVDSTACC